MKKIIIIALTLVVLAIVAYFVVPIFVNSESYVVIDINPSVEFVINGSGVVTKVNSLNEDGKIIVEGEEFIGLTIEEATEKVVEIALALGYMNPDAVQTDPNALLITTYNGNKIVQNRIQSRVQNRLNSYFSEHGIWSVVLNAEDVDELVTEAKAYGVSIGKYRLIKSVQNVNNEYTFEQLADMSVKNLLGLIADKPTLAEERVTITERLGILEAVGEPTLEQTAEMLTLTARLGEIDGIIAQAGADKANLDAMVQAFKQSRNQYRQTVKEQIKNLYNGLTDTKKEQIKQALCDRFNNLTPED